MIYSAKLEIETICLTQDFHKKSCFFLISHITDSTFIRALAEYLLEAGGRDFHFWGDKESVWHLLFDEVDVERTIENDLEDIALTSGYDNIEDFSRELWMQFSQDVYLFYDDLDAYQRVFQSKVDR